MRIAIVNQYCDSMLPPRQNSVGTCTYGLARQLAPHMDVRVYGLAKDGQLSQDVEDQGVVYRLLAPSRFDRFLAGQAKRISHLYRSFNDGMLMPRSAAPWIFPNYGHRVAEDIAKHPVDIVFFQHTTQYLKPIKTLNKDAKVILNVHHEIYPQCDFKMIAKRLSYVDQITTVSQFVADRVHSSIAPQTTPVPILNGIEVSEFATNPSDYVLKGGGPRRIMYAGAISPEKGLHVLLKAMPAVVEKFPDIRLDICGRQSSRPLNEIFPQRGDVLLGEMKQLYSSNYQAELRKLLDDRLQDAVTFHGMVSRQELVQRYYDSDVFVFPSLWNEGFGLPPIEAMAAGTPVIATRTGALVETIQEGVTGHLVERNDPETLAAALISVLSNDEHRRQMGAAARRKVMDTFTWGKSANRLLRVIDELGSGGRKTTS